jgi:hypothetical protein
MIWPVKLDAVEGGGIVSMAVRDSFFSACVVAGSVLVPNERLTELDAPGRMWSAKLAAVDEGGIMSIMSGSSCSNDWAAAGSVLERVRRLTEPVASGVIEPGKVSTTDEKQTRGQFPSPLP